MKPESPERDEEREERISMEIIVDAHDGDEARSGWYYYLQDTLEFPFEAKCIRARKSSPLKPGERVTVLGMLDDEEDDGLGEMVVEVKWRDRTLGVPLAQLEGMGVDEDSAEAIADWHYWVARGRGF